MTTFISIKSFEWEKCSKRKCSYIWIKCEERKRFHHYRIAEDIVNDHKSIANNVYKEPITSRVSTHCCFKQTLVLNNTSKITIINFFPKNSMRTLCGNTFSPLFEKEKWDMSIMNLRTLRAVVRYTINLINLCRLRTSQGSELTLKQTRWWLTCNLYCIEIIRKYYKYSARKYL